MLSWSANGLQISPGNGSVRLCELLSLDDLDTELGNVRVRLISQETSFDPLASLTHDLVLAEPAASRRRFPIADRQ